MRFCTKCGSPLQYALHVLDPGDQVGQYRIKMIVGYGGFGAVYEAESLTNRRSVALKETFDPASIQSFQKEFAILHSIRHPNLPFYEDLFEANGNGYLVMEYVPGQSLEEVLQKRQGPLLETQVLGYTIQLCDVLSFLHGRTPWILHRDIKPANIRLTPEGVIKLVDFGLIRQGPTATRSTHIGLTPTYAPIEQYGAASTDPRTDIYSLGATLYHLLTGQEPLPATARVASTVDPLQPPHMLNPQLSRSTSDAILKAMAITQDKRFSSAAEFKQVLLQAQSAQSAFHTQLVTPARAKRTTQQAQVAYPSMTTIQSVPISITPTCKNCFQVQPPDEIYCQRCLAPIQDLVPCRACRKPSPKNAKFCPNCGKRS